jgi:hypothetical protein
MVKDVAPCYKLLQGLPLLLQALQLSVWKAIQRQPDNNFTSCASVL